MAYRARYRTLMSIASWALAGVAQAQPLPSASLSRSSTDFLVWEAPPSCGTAEAVSLRIQELLGESTWAVGSARRVEARISPTSSGWALDLRVSGDSGRRERRLEAEACGDLAEAAAVAISLAIDAERAGGEASKPDPSDAEATASRGSAGARRPPSSDSPTDRTATLSSSPVVTRTSPMTSAPASDVASSSASPGGSPARLSVGAEFVSDITSLSAFAPGASLIVRLRRSELALDAYGFGLAATERTLGPGQSVRFALVGGGLRACYRLAQGLVDTALCAGIEAGRLSAKGVGLRGAQNVHDLWLTPDAGLELGSTLSGAVSAYVRGDAVVPLLRQAYAVNETDRVHRVSAVGVRGVLGVLITF